MATATQHTPGETTATPEPAPPRGPGSRWARLQAYREQHAKAEIAVFFAAGFLFDVVTLDRIDSWFSIGQQAVYLTALGALLLYEQRHELGLAKPGKWMAKLWRFGEDAIHFLLGSLLSSFSLFFLKSASSVASLVFMAAIFGVLLANELPRFRRLGHVVRVGLYGFCVTSYFAYLVPVLIGFLSTWLFLLAILASAGVGWLLFALVRRWSGTLLWPLRRIAAPFAAVQLALLGLYFARAVPPVPLSAQHMGIYHAVERHAGKYKLAHQRPAWKFWHSGDQYFRARPGDRVYAFARVFAPNRFDDKVGFRWQYDDPKRGWIEFGRPYRVKLGGGRSEGWRTFAYLTDPPPGDWKVELLTEDDRVIGSLRFTVEEDESTEPREFFEDEM